MEPSRKPKLLNDRSENILLRRFNTEFSQAIREILGNKLLPRMLHYETYVTVLKRMRLLAKNHSTIDACEPLVLALWNFLSFVHDRSYGYNPSIQPQSFAGRILTGDLKVFLMAICGIKGNKRINISEKDSKKVSIQQYGFINSKKQLCLTVSDVKKIQAEYKDMKTNRLSNERAFPRTRSVDSYMLQQ